MAFNFCALLQEHNYSVKRELACVLLPDTTNQTYNVTKPWQYTEVTLPKSSHVGGHKQLEAPILQEQYGWFPYTKIHTLASARRNIHTLTVTHTNWNKEWDENSIHIQNIYCNTWDKNLMAQLPYILACTWNIQRLSIIADMSTTTGHVIGTADVGLLCALVHDKRNALNMTTALCVPH